MKSLKSQRGAIDIILIVVVAVLLAGLGGYVYYQQQQNNKAYDASHNGVTVTKKSKKVTKPVADPTADWTAYTSVKGKFSLKYPPTWVQPTNKELCSEGLFDRTLYLGQTKDSVLKCATEYFGVLHVGSVAGDKRADSNFGSGWSSITKKLVTVSGVTGERSMATKVHPANEFDGNAGDKEIQYVFYTNGITYIASYTLPVQGPFPDVTEDFDTMITKTLKFN